MGRPLLVSLTVVVLALASAGCVVRPDGAESVGPGPLVVATSITPLADLIGQVGGLRVQVLALVPAGGEPEDFHPTPADATAAARARIIFANGLGLDSYLADLAEAGGNRQARVITLSAGRPVLGGFGQGAEEGGNPHLWLDPRHAAAYVEVIRQALSEADPPGSSQYQENAVAYSARLAELDAYIEQRVLSIPASQRVLVSTHDVFPYFAERYGLVYLAAVTGGHGADPSAQEYAALVQTVRDRSVRAVFGEAGFSDRFVAQLAADTGARYVAGLYTDTLAEQPPADSYLGAMRFNADAIVEALR